MFGTFAQEVLFDEALERPEIVRVLAVDERQRAQCAEIFVAVGSLGH